MRGGGVTARANWASVAFCFAAIGCAVMLAGGWGKVASSASSKLWPTHTKPHLGHPRYKLEEAPSRFEIAHKVWWQRSGLQTNYHYHAECIDMPKNGAVEIGLCDDGTLVWKE